MKIYATLSALLTGFVATGSTAAVGNPQGGHVELMSLEGGFASSCENFEITNRRIPNQRIYSINAVCPDPNGVKYKTSIQLNRCLKNQDGKLAWAEIGHFDDSCEGCSLQKINKNEVELRCICPERWDKPMMFTSINLNENIRNQGATLWCFNQIGTREA
ncbi:uncharacterized protein CTRU02_206579 [Colletotrichum truncatum]|uniref:Uncharacterized protein n=1 Tax=Colletotrichum truncatum TaxID=5467 RepID=A0ACC3Z7A7_COLTU|nr:uncharacterized protein CTRU02_11948 [Colletotrichum truncatum]KAF6785323.1 hypothetical protein CTRU02_11948 [Colletotrichum truncatum]